MAPQNSGKPLQVGLVPAYDAAPYLRRRIRDNESFPFAYHVFWLDWIEKITHKHCWIAAVSYNAYGFFENALKPLYG